jgi:transcriptional regulator with GAF, ATPase, and Fis domain/tetratricopeptide (TPR) repeat protein/energy-coupling factor transporter ATP-binding protein EcfA2
MYGDKARDALNARYSVRKALGEYPPWHGYSVTDSLSERAYLLFSVDTPPGLSLSIEDLRMRDHLFSRSQALAPAVVSLQQTNGSITFLLPYAEIVPLAGALPRMNPPRVEEIARAIVSYVLSRIGEGLSFCNLSLESFYMKNDEPGMLPVAYLLPGDILRRMSTGESDSMGRAEAPFGDLREIGNVLSIVAPHLDTETADRIKRLAVRLQTLARETPGAEFDSALDELSAFAGVVPAPGRPLVPRILEPAAPAAAMRAMKHAALKAREGERQVVIVTGPHGSGKTSFLELAARSLVTDWGFRRSEMTGDLTLYQDPVERDSAPSGTCAIIDNHADEPLLACHVVDYVCQAIERCDIVVVSGAAEAPLLARHVSEEASRRGISVKEIELHATAQAGRKRAPEKDVAFLDALPGDERSVLAFLAVFGFEVPLPFLLGIFAPEEIGIFSALQNLIARGLVKSRAETSSLAGGALAMVYATSSGSVAREVLRNLPRERRESIHRSIARLLVETRNAPALYTFFHLVRSGAREEAALKGLEILRLFMKRKKSPALNCFSESYMEEKLDRALPVDARFGLYLDLGNQLSLTGNMEQAECFYHRCREEISREADPSRFRNLAVEATRRESEILEKRGEFLKAEKLLEKALDTHGEKLLSSERAKLYNDIAWIHYRIGAFDRSWEHCLVVHKLLDEKQNPAEIAQAYNLMGTINWNRSRYDDAILCYKRCLALREECGDEIGIAANYNNLGLVYRSLGMVTEALECFTKSMEIKKRHENLPGLAAAHLNMALVYLDLEQIKDAERSCVTALRLAEEIGNQQLLAESYGTMGEIWFLQGSYDKAQSCYAKDLELCDKTRSLRERAVVYRKLGDLNFSLGKLAETKELLAQARSLNQKIGSRLETALLNLLEGKILLAEGKRDDGRYKLEGAGLELSLLGKKNAASAIAAEIGTLHLEEGNEPLAREYLLRAMSLVSGDEQAPLQARRLQDALDARSPLSRDQIVSDADRFRAICRLSSLLRTVRDKETLRSTIVETARRITAMDRAALLTKAEGLDSFRVAAASGGFSTGSTLAEANIVAVLSMAVQLGYPLDVSRTKIPEGKISRDFLEEHPRLICVPLRISGDAAEFLYLDSTRSAAPTSDEDHGLLLSFCQEAASALEKMLLLERIDALEKSRSVVKSGIVRPKERVSFQDLIGSSSPMRHVRELIEGIADMDTTVLLTGSNGTGKDLIAKTIHYGGHRAERPFVSLNCSAIPGELLESELFGHEKGAFTGAFKQRIGHFESAKGGTVFLNEIGDMPLQLQPKLLHFLENQAFYRLGGTTKILTNVRIITATNKDLLGLVREGRFREDLFYRINIFPIRVPDLKERAEDIEPLCAHFLSTFCRLYGIPLKKISAEAMALLVSYDWPGNVRELENLINRIIIISKKETILPEDLPDNVLKRPESARAQSRATIEETIDTLIENVELSTGDPILPRIEGMIVNKVVEKIGDKTKAAAVLGISKPTVYAKLKRYGKNKGS